MEVNAIYRLKCLHTWGGRRKASSKGAVIFLFRSARQFQVLPTDLTLSAVLFSWGESKFTLHYSVVMSSLPSKAFLCE